MMDSKESLKEGFFLPFDKGGEMGEMIKRFDWTQTPLGSIETWPSSLITMLGVVLGSKLPMLLCWGPELIQFYNDANKEVLSRFSKHPAALGQPAAACWSDIWPELKPLTEQVLVEGASALAEDFSYTFYNANELNESSWTFSISPAYGENGTVAGLLLIGFETTDLGKKRKNTAQMLQDEQVLNDKLQATNDELAKANVALTMANSEVRSVEKQLRESEEKYEALFRLSPLPMWIYDRDTLKFLEVNDMAIRKYGYSRSEFLQMSLLDIRPAEDVPKFVSAKNRAKSYADLHFTGVFRHLKRDGSLLIVEVYGHHFRYQGKTCVMVVTNDITEKEKTQNLQRQKDEQLTAATAIAKLGYWQMDTDGGNTYWSDEVFNIWMIPRETDLTDWKSLLKKIHPGDRERFAAKQESSLGGFKDVDLEYRLMMPGGSVKWVHEIGKIVRNKKGKTIKIEGTVQDITSQKLLAISLQESNERFQYAARLTSQAIWQWDAAQPELFKEYGYQQLFGYQLKDHIGEVAFWQSNVHPDDYGRIWEAMEMARMNPGANEWALEYRFKKANGEYLHLKEKAILMRDENGGLLKMIGAMHDITRRKNEERHLRLLESVITNTSDSVLVTLATPLDEHGPSIIYANQSFAEMTGYEVSELLNKTPRILQGPNSDKEELKRLGQALRDQEPCEINTINYKKNGQEYWVNISVNPVKDDQGVVSHFIAIQRDITEKKKEEEAIKLFADDLYKRNQELQQFGYLVSHNLRSPVANIIGIATLLELEKDEPSTVERCIVDLKSSINRLDDVIRDMSKILSINDNPVELMKEPIDLTSIITEITTDLHDTIGRFDITIEYPNSSFIVISHKAYLYSIFYNLITNAIKYRSQNKLIIKINISKDDNRIRIEVSDNGIGIDLTRHSDEIFKPYRRFQSQIEGKGLGLFLVKSHVEALKGQISVSSKVGAGTIFTFTLPVH